MAHRYQPLKTSVNEIRILSLLPASERSSEICCKLHTVSLDSNPVYIALSYCWGDPTNPRRILLDHCVKEVSDQRESLAYSLTAYQVTANLHEALSSLRDPEDTISLWVDALCINQDDLEERSLQVLRMTAIYRSAMKVYS
jgi:hypothetical protein